MIETHALPNGEERGQTKDRKAPDRLLRRADFQRAARGRRSHAPAFTLQSARRPESAEETQARFGLTVTKKVGNSPVRNRIRRRLREALRLAALEARADHDYVLVARFEALSRPFDQLKQDLARALSAAHSPGIRPASPPKPV